MQASTLRPAMIALALLAGSIPALAYENFDKGKSPPELFKSDCGICHKSAVNLGAELSPSALSDFVAEHYTATEAAAHALTAYLLSVRRSQGNSGHHGPAHRPSNAHRLRLPSGPHRSAAGRGQSGAAVPSGRALAALRPAG